MDNVGDVQTAIVTGGGGGIGSEVVRRMRDVGYRVAVVDLVPGPFANSEDEGILFIESDVTSRDATEEAFAQITSWGGNVSKLNTCVGGGEYTDSYNMSASTWDRHIAMNLTGTYNWCQVVGRHMRGNGGGSIVTIGSITATRGFPGRLVYGVAKAAIHQLTRGLAVEWADDGIRVNCVAPGYVVSSPRFHEAVSLDLETLGTLHAVGRPGVSGEIAAAVMFLLSDEASFITGEVLFADGGFSVLARPRGYEGAVAKGTTSSD